MRTFRSTTVGAASAVVLALTALASTNSANAATTAAATTTTSSAGSDVSRVRWGSCADPRLQAAGAVCGFVTAPLDYSNPRTGTVQIAVSKIAHTVPADKYQGIMLVNPGGPGGSGLGLAVLGSYVPAGAGDAYDWIGFDPRGVGSSIPALSCIPDYFTAPRPIYEPFSNATEQFWRAKAKTYSTACGQNGGVPLLKNLRTVDTVRDMDRIRAALGERQLNFFGFSYGTYLGQVYATMFPERVRRMVLDSNVDPTRVWYQANLDQDVAFERNIKIWWAWLAQYDSVYHLGSTEKAVEKAWYDERAKLAKHPAGGVVGASEWSDIFLYAGYYQVTWLGLADLWANWNATHADAQPLIDEYNADSGVGDDNGYAMYLAVQCVDAAWPRDWATWREDNWRTYRVAPFETWSNAWYNAPCATWPAPASRPVDVDGSKAPPILLVDETLDAATPYSGSLEVRRRFPRSSLLALPGGTSHANSLFGDACEDDLIAAYLADGSLPARRPGKGPDATCAPLPVPDPTAIAAAPLSAASAAGAATLRAPSTSSAAAGRYAVLDQLLHSYRP